MVSPVIVQLLLRKAQMQILEIVALAAFISVVLTISLGALWMIWAGVRHHEALESALLAGFVPFAFIWYYSRRANELEKWQLVRVVRIGLTSVWIFTGIAFAVRGGTMRVVSIPLLIGCCYISYLVSKSERTGLNQT
jgi:hypothetical protein